MFLNRLGAQEQETFLSAAARLMAVDGVHEAEQAAMRTLLVSAGMPPTWEPDQETPLPELLGQIVSAEARRATLLELLGMAHADTVYGPEERDFIQGAAAIMGISEVEVALMESWVARQLALAAEAERLLRGH